MPSSSYFRHRPLLALLSCLTAPAALTQQEYRLTILHTNDVHAHHEPQSRSGDGGAARQAAVVNALRRALPNSVLVDAGDRFTGTLFHNYYRGADSVRIMNAIGYDVMALGNHEFDDGLEVLGRFVAGAEFAVLAANVDFSGLDDGALAEHVAASTVLDVGGEKIGFIGLVTAETPGITINFPGKERLRWNGDYAGVVNDEAARLSASGIDKIVVITHIGLGVDRELAAASRNVDLIVGGHSHVAVSNIYKEAGDNGYPLSVDNADGEPVYIVQAGDRGRYLGRLDLSFDADGRVTRARGDLILLGAFITPDPDVQALVDELAEPINRLRNTPIAGDAGSPVAGSPVAGKPVAGKPVHSLVLLSNRDCRVGECALGSLIADALRAETGAQVALHNGGGIRADIDEGEITIGEVLTVLPFGNTTATLTIGGAGLLAALENGVSRVGADSGSGRFPQVSGLRFRFDPAREPGARIVSAEVDGPDGFAPLDPRARYTVATNNFLRTGGDGYQSFVDDAIDPYDFGRPLEEVLIDYMIANAPVDRDVDGRIATP